MKQVLTGVLLSLLVISGIIDAHEAAPALVPAIEYAADNSQPLLTPEQEQANVVFDISLHELSDIELLFKRLEQLATKPHAQGEVPKIVLVLHGPEVEFFALKNYPHYQKLVDLAAKLSAFELIEIKACQTRMKSLGLTDADMPAFIDLVPYGPDEIERLVDENYIRM